MSEVSTQPDLLAVRVAVAVPVADLLEQPVAVLVTVEELLLVTRLLREKVLDTEGDTVRVRVEKTLLEAVLLLVLVTVLEPEGHPEPLTLGSLEREGVVEAKALPEALGERERPAEAVEVAVALAEPDTDLVREFTAELVLLLVALTLLNTQMSLRMAWLEVSLTKR